MGNCFHKSRQFDEVLPSFSQEKKHRSIDFAAQRLPRGEEFQRLSENPQNEDMIRKREDDAIKSSRTIFEEHCKLIEKKYKSITKLIDTFDTEDRLIITGTLEIHKRSGLDKQSYKSLHTRFNKALENFQKNEDISSKWDVDKKLISEKIKEVEAIFNKLKQIEGKMIKSSKRATSSGDHAKKLGPTRFRDDISIVEH